LHKINEFHIRLAKKTEPSKIYRKRANFDKGKDIGQNNDQILRELQ